jgi:hypothetical protein
MKKIPTQIKKRIKQRSKTVHIIGVMQPPGESISENDLRKFDPHITHVELAEWAQDFQKRQQYEKPFQATEEDSIYMSLLLADAQRHLFDGVYNATKENPLFAMEAFVAAHYMGLYPPPWVLDWLYDAFAKYLTSNDEENLAKLLKAKRGQGKQPIKKEGLKLQIETNAMNQILGLNISGTSIDDAAALVAERFEVQGIECPSADTLAERFTKRGWGAISKALKIAIKESKVE